MFENSILLEATVNDVDELSDLVNSAYRGESSKVGWTTEADLLGGQRTDPQSLRQEITTPDQKILVLKNRVTGAFEACVFLKKMKDDICYLGMLTVKPNLQSAGLGKILLREAEAFARKWSCTEMKMTVIAQRSELLAWYIRRGYQVTGNREEFPYGDEKFGLPKREDLYFEVLTKELKRNF